MTGAPAILILAAGASRRMGGADKLLEPVDGTPLLRRQAIRALATGNPVIVTLPPDRPLRAQAIDGLPLIVVEVANAKLGMGHSLAAGVSALPADAAGVLVLPADMPDISTDDIAACLAAFSENPNKILRATNAVGAPGHPVIFPARLFSALNGLSGDEGARAVLKQEDVRPHAIPGQHALTDLDTPEDWA
ncbi:MAG: nucleotidyltransferase family protein, partial [Paracoccaceae bacterium]|nr:nucleotidyltransferase family protein [Paracoccaceae bacterium]